MSTFGTLQKALQTWWKRLTEPAGSVQSREQRQWAQLMASSLFVVFLINILLCLLRTAAGVSSKQELVSRIVLVLLILLLYVLARRGRHREAAGVAVVSGTLVLYVLALMQKGDAALLTLNYLAVVIIFGSLFLPLPITALVFITHVVGLLIYPQFVPRFSMEDVINRPLSLNLTLAPITLLVALYRNILEAERRAELAESEARFRELIFGLPDTVYTVDLTTRQVNYYKDQFLGYSKTELQSEGSIIHALHPEDRENVMAHWQAIMQNLPERATNIEYRVKTKEGRWEWVQMRSLVSLHDKDGSPKELQFVLGEISERKQAEEALINSEERYRRLVEFSPAAMAVHSGGEIVYANRATVRLFGAEKPEDLLGKPVLSFVHPDYQEIVTERIYRTQVEGKEVSQLVEKFVRLDGESIDVEVVAIPITYNEKPATQVVILDITERERALEALAVEKAHFEQLFQSAPEGIAVVDNTGIVMRANDEFTRLFGYTLDEVIGQSIDTLVASGDLYDEATSITKQVVRGERVAFETLRQHKDGRLIHVSFLGAPVVVDGVQVAIYGIYRDITQRKRVEEELKNYRGHLERLVSKRTAELEAANRELQVLSRLKDEFVSNVSHELRTPITSIKLYHTLLQKRTDKQKEYHQKLGRELARLTLLIENLLRLSRFDQGYVVLDLRPVDLNLLAVQYVEDRRIIAEEHGLRLKLVEASGPVFVRADMGILGQALSILLTNAFNYTPAGGEIKVQIESCPQDDLTPIHRTQTFS